MTVCLIARAGRKPRGMMYANNRDIIHRFFRALEANDLPALLELLDPAYVDHSLAPKTAPVGVFEAATATLVAFRQSLPSAHIEIELIIEEGEHTVALWRVHSHVTASTDGGPRIPFSRQAMGLTYFRIRAGRILERRMGLSM